MDAGFEAVAAGALGLEDGDRVNHKRYDVEQVMDLGGDEEVGRLKVVEAGRVVAEIAVRFWSLKTPVVFLAFFVDADDGIMLIDCWHKFALEFEVRGCNKAVSHERALVFLVDIMAYRQGIAHGGESAFDVFLYC